MSRFRYLPIDGPGVPEHPTREWVEENGLTDHEAEELFRDLLDEVYGDVSICGLAYSASLALERVDEIAYRCAFADYTSEYFVEVYLPDIPVADDDEDE